MFLVIKFVVYFDYMLSIVGVINMIMHRITERSIKCSNWLSNRTLCKRGAYIMFCLWMHPTCRNVWLIAGVTASLILCNPSPVCRTSRT